MFTLRAMLPDGILMRDMPLAAASQRTQRQYGYSRRGGGGGGGGGGVGLHAAIRPRCRNITLDVTRNLIQIAYVLFQG